jgi:hypothetical protein
MKIHARSMSAALFLLVVISLLFIPVKSNAATIEYALLTQGASVYSASTAYNGGNQTMNENLLRPDKVAWLSNGETGYIFANGDKNQTITIDLGSTRSINRVGANFSAPYADREVWDYLGISVATNISSFSLVGKLGTKNDDSIDVKTTPVFFNLSGMTDVRYVKYEFGQYSLDYGDGGSRVTDLYAQAAPVPIPAAAWLLVTGLLGILSVRRKLNK